MPTIYTHVNPDLDAIASVWAVRTFVPTFADAPIRLVPASWDGEGLDPGDLAVDIEAGGKGMKGLKDPDGTVHSAVALIASRHCNEADRSALAPLIQFVDILETSGNVGRWVSGRLGPPAKGAAALPDDRATAVESMLLGTDLNAVFRAVSLTCNGELAPLLERMGQVFTGMLMAGRALVRGEADADRAISCAHGQVALIMEPKEQSTNAALFKRGFRAIVYRDGANLGVCRSIDETARMDHPLIRELVEQAGEAPEWFAHSSGFLYCRGSRKAPATTPSRVDPHALAEAVGRALLPLTTPPRTPR